MNSELPQMGRLSQPSLAPASRGEDTVVLCCRIMEDELGRVLDEISFAPRLVWLDAGMHRQPEHLRKHLNETLKTLNCRRVLMALGHCGGASVGLETGDYEMIIPRADDCLSLLMGSVEKRKQAGRGAATFFLTAGWLRYPDNLIDAFDRDVRRFGPEKAGRIYRIMLKHYRRFGFIETGAYDPEPEERKIAPLADLLGIGLERLAGDAGWLRRLLTGPWPPSEFLTVPPYSRLEEGDWDWLGEAASGQLF